MQTRQNAGFDESWINRCCACIAYSFAVINAEMTLGTRYAPAIFYIAPARIGMSIGRITMRIGFAQSPSFRLLLARLIRRF